MEDRKAEMPYVLQDTPGGPCGEVGGVTDMKVRAVFGQDIFALFPECCELKFVLGSCCGMHVVWLWLHLRLDMEKKKWKMKRNWKAS